MSEVLSKRLKAIASQVRPGEKVADIGTGHGLLPVFLIKKNIAAYVVASDLNPGPLKRVVEQVKNSIVAERVSVRGGYGLEVLKPGEVEVIILSGIGGENICEILEASPEILARNPRLVLQPMTSVNRVRLWLADNGWLINDEDLVEEEGKFYEIIAAEKGSMSLNITELEIGPVLLMKKHPMLVPFLKKKIKHMRKVLTMLGKAKGEEAEQKKKEVENSLQKLEKVISWLSDAQKL